MVTRLPVQEGEMVVIGIQNQPGTTLMTISDLSRDRRRGEGGRGGRPAVQRRSDRHGHPRGHSRRDIPGRVVESAPAPCRSAGTGAAAREFKVKVRLDQPDPAAAARADVRHRDPHRRTAERARRAAAGGGRPAGQGRQGAAGRLRGGRPRGPVPARHDRASSAASTSRSSGVDRRHAGRGRSVPGAPRSAGRPGRCAPGSAS